MVIARQIYDAMAKVGVSLLERNLRWQVSEEVGADVKQFAWPYGIQAGGLVTVTSTLQTIYSHVTGHYIENGIAYCTRNL